MKKNKFTIAAIAAAAITAAPMFVQSISTFADTPVYQTSTSKFTSYQIVTGSLTVTPNHNAQLYNDSASTIDKQLKAGTNSVYTAIVTIYGDTYYKVDTNAYVKAADAVIVSNVTPIAQQVTIQNDRTFVFSGLGTATTAKNAYTPLVAGSTYNSTEMRTVNGTVYYRIGADQYVKKADVTPSETQAQPVAKPSAFKMTAVGKISYVPGYGIQVWTKGHGFVSENGNLKKLQHGTSWKIFASAQIDGGTYYNVGGNQWIDSAYVNIVD